MYIYELNRPYRKVEKNLQFVNKVQKKNHNLIDLLKFIKFNQ